MRLLIVSLFLLLTGCQSGPNDVKEWMKKTGHPKVLCTTAMICDLVKQVGGEHIDTLTLITGELDPHSYQLVKGDDEKLRYANLIFYNGLNLEHGPSLHSFLEKSDRAIGVGNKIMQDNNQLILHYNNQLDPHIWMDISLWSETLPYIVEGLIALDPDHAPEYRENAQKVKEQMVLAHKEIKEKLHQIPANKRFLVTSHDAFNYFARAYLAEESELADNSWQKRFAAPEGLSPESQLSTQDIQLIIDYLKAHDIHVLFPESNVSQDSIRKILNAGNEHGLNLQIAQPFLYGDAMGAPGSSGDTYLKMIQHNAKMIGMHLNE